MELKYTLISPAELTRTEILIAHCSPFDFCFLYFKGVLKINKKLPQLPELLDIAAAMWEYDHPLNDSEAAEVDTLYNRVAEIAGQNAAAQLHSEWGQAVRDKANQDNRKAAAQWFEAHNIPDELDALNTDREIYRPCFLRALWQHSRDIDALFLFGYLSGLEAAKTAATA